MASRVARVRDRLFKLLAGLVGGLPDLAALLRREARDVTQEVRELGLAAEVGDPDGLERLGSGCAVDRRVGFGGDFCDPVQAHGVRVAILVSSYRATVAAIAALSECVWIGM